MSNIELEAKCRELRQIQALIEEAQAEAEAIKDAIKAQMGQEEDMRAGEYRITWKPVETVRLDSAALRKAAPMLYDLYARKPPSAASAWHKEGPHIPAAKQEDMKPRQPRRGSWIFYHGPLQKSKEWKIMEKRKSNDMEFIGLIQRAKPKTLNTILNLLKLGACSSGFREAFAAATSPAEGCPPVDKIKAIVNEWSQKEGLQ